MIIFSRIFLLTNFEEMKSINSSQRTRKRIPVNLRSSRSLMFFKICVQENRCTSLTSCNFILKKILQHRCFPINTRKFLRLAFLWNIPVAASVISEIISCSLSSEAVVSRKEVVAEGVL